MDSQRFMESVAAHARQMGAVSAQKLEGSVIVRFDERTPADLQIGRACIEISADALNIHDYWHVMSASGAAWSRMLAGIVGNLEVMRTRLLH